MNILFLARLYLPHIGGVEKHVEKISQDLVKKGHKITIITSQHDRKLKLKEKQGSIKIFRIPTPLLNSKFSTWQWIYNHQHLFTNAHIVHVHDVFWWCLPLRFLMLSKPFFTTFHGWEGKYPPTKKAIYWRKLAEKLSRGNICVGGFIPKWYSTKPNLITYGATDQKPLKKSQKKGNVLVLGRLSKDNDMDVVVKALKQVTTKNPTIHITYVGDGPYSSRAKKNGHVVGFTNRLSTYLNRSNLVITSSYLSIIDSLAAGRSVFSVYSNPIKKDYLTLHPASKWLNISPDSKHLYKQINLFLNSPKKLEHKTSQAQSWALKQTWSKLTQSYIRLWQHQPQQSQ